MSLSCEEECDRILWVVHNLVETLKVSEEKMRTLVCSETAAEADGESVRVNLLEKLYHTCWVALVAEPYILELNLDILSEHVLQCETCLPELSIWTLVDAVPE